MFRFSRVSSSVKAAWLSTITRPSRSSSFPRGASTGTVLMRLRSASWLLLSASRTCRIQKLAIRRTKMARAVYWKPAIRPRAKCVSSCAKRRSACCCCSGFSGSTAIKRSRESALFRNLQFIQHVEQRHRDHGIQRGHNQRRWHIETFLLRQQRPRQNPIEELMEEIEKETQHQSHAGIIDVEPLSGGGRKVSHQRFYDAEHPQRIGR